MPAVRKRCCRAEINSVLSVQGGEVLVQSLQQTSDDADDDPIILSFILAVARPFLLLFIVQSDTVLMSAVSLKKYADLKL